MLNTLFDPYLRIAFWTGIGAVALALLATTLIIHLRLGLIRRSRREKAFQAVWRPILVNALVASPPSPPPALAAGERVFFLSLWVQLQESIRGPQSPGLLDVAYRLGCDAFAREFLEAGNPAEQLLAILALGHLRDRSAWSLLLGVAHTTDSLRSFSALRGLVQIDAEAAAAQLTPLVLVRTDWPLARVAALLQSVQADFSGPLLKAAEDAESKSLVRTLRFIEALRLQLPVPVLARLLSSDQPIDIVIGALRVTLAPASLPHVRALLDHADWRVRVQVAKTLARIGEFQDIVSLSKLLSDREWWVRYCAASALVGLPFVSLPQVDLLRRSVADPFAQDILEQVLCEKAAA